VAYGWCAGVSTGRAALDTATGIRSGAGSTIVPADIDPVAIAEAQK